jgi:hypothetical protein
LILSGLQPNRLYYFQLTSRDQAGNVTTDNQQGQFYTFLTLTPLSPPWTDNLESGEGSWLVFDNDLTDSSWELGVPQNNRGVTAHSPVNAWGSNLRSQPSGLAETWLISPPVFLAEGSQPTLRFWHNFNMLDLEEDVLEGGVVQLITNAATLPIDLRAYTNSTAGWEEQVLDLSPHAGKLVYVVWYYLLMSLQDASRLGWLVDDVSITIDGSGEDGTIIVSNNLAQASWVLSGPLNHSGLGIQTIPAAPPGQYTLTFEPVLFYQTPSPLTQNLVARSTVLFRGNYSFVDQNANGMSDAWEQQEFGEVCPTRTAQTDTDGDGQTDQAEFIAGTDPNAASSVLQMATPVLMSGGTLRLEWLSTPGRVYQVQGSSDALVWTPVSDWLQATGSSLSVDVPPPSPGAAFLFRVEVRP